MVARNSFLFCVAALFSQGALSFTVVNDCSSIRSSSSLNYANAETVESSKLSTFRDSIAKSYRKFEDPESSATLILSNQLAREFTTARRYMLAAGAVKVLTQDFYAAEEEQRFRAMELIEYARVNGIKLNDYASQIDKTPIDKSLAPTEFIKELLLQEQQDVNFLDQAMAKASESLTSPDLVNFLESMRNAHMGRQEEVSEMLAQVTPSLDIAQGVSVIESASSQTGDFASQFSLEHLPKAEDFGGIFGNNQQQAALPTALPHVTAAGAIGVAAVDPDSLPSTEEILDALPINTDDFVQAVDTTASTFATFIEEQSDLVDTLQQNLMEAENLSQILDIVANLC